MWTTDFFAELGEQPQKKFRFCWVVSEVLLPGVLWLVAAVTGSFSALALVTRKPRPHRDAPSQRAWAACASVLDIQLPTLVARRRVRVCDGLAQQSREELQPLPQQHRQQPRWSHPDRQYPQQPTSVQPSVGRQSAAPQHPPLQDSPHGSTFALSSSFLPWRMRRQATCSARPCARPPQQQPSAVCTGRYGALVCYAPVVELRCLQLKISDREPEDLPADYADRLRALTSACGWFLPSVCVRKGCVELTLDIENADLDPDGGDPDRERGSPAGAAARLTTDKDAVTDSATGGATTVSDSDATPGGSGGRLDLTTAEGALALAQRVHASMTPSGGAVDATGRGGESGNRLAGASTAVVALPMPAGVAGIGPTGVVAVAASTSGDRGRPPRLERVTHSAGLGHPSCFNAPPRGPAITRVYPRVVEVGREAHLETRQAQPRAPEAETVISDSDAGAAASSCGSAEVEVAVGSASLGAAEAAAPAGQRPRGPTRTLSLCVELCAPPCVSLNDLAPPLPPTLLDAGGGAVAAATTGPIAVVPANDPSVELLVRCSGRYLPVHIQPAAPAHFRFSDGHDAAPQPDVLEPLGGAGAGLGCGGGGSAAGPTVRRSFVVTLLETPPAGCGVLLVDLRWQGHPAQVVPVVLLGKQDEQLREELSAVAATWTGPPHELDGLLYDFGAWLRCMAVRRAASAAAPAAAAGMAATSAASSGAAAAATGHGSGSAGPVVVVAATAGAVAGGQGGCEPPYVPVLGASLLQFAHAQGLLAMAARLQTDMRGCGYTAPFRPLLRSQVPSSVPAQFVQLRPVGRFGVAGAATALVAAAWSGSVARESARRASPQLDPASASRGAGHARPVSSGCKGRAALAPPEKQGGAVAGRAAGICWEGFSSLERAEPAATSLGLASHCWRAVTRQLRLLWRLCGLRGTRAEVAEEEEAYQAFVESYGASISCVFHLLDMLAFLELLLDLGLTLCRTAAHAHLGGRGAGGGAALLRLPLPLLLSFAVTSLPAAAAAAAWLLLPPPVWRRVAPAARLARHASLVAGRLVSMLLAGGAVPSAGGRLYFQGCILGPGALVMEGVVVPVACLLPPSAALLLAAIKLPLYVAAGSAAAGYAAAAAGGGGFASGAEVLLGRPGDPWVSPRVGSPLAESVFRALAVTATALISTLACHAFLRQQFQRQLSWGLRGSQGGLADGKAAAKGGA